METPRRIKKRWQVGVMVCTSLGALALIPAIIDYEVFWPWVPSGSGAMWCLALVLYLVGKKVTGAPLRQPRIR